MEPEHSAKDFFAEVMDPVEAVHVKQFVSGNRRLEAGVQRRKTLWKEHDRSHKPERDGRIHLGGQTELRGSSYQGSHCLENGGRFCSRGDWPRGLAESVKFEKTEIGRASCREGVE